MINKEEVTLECPNCKEMSIQAIEIKGFHTIEKGFTGRSGQVYKKGSTVLLTEICPNCNKRVKL